MALNFPIFTPQEARDKRGPEAREMLHCVKCDQAQGVFVLVVAQTSNIQADNHRLSKVILEKWLCINCRHKWVEKYGINSEPSESAGNPQTPPACGIEKDLIRAVLLKMGETKE